MLGLYHCHNPDNLIIFVPCFGYGSRVRLGVYYHMYNHKLACMTLHKLSGKDSN
jgi:hypothetical protein